MRAPGMLAPLLRAPRGGPAFVLQVAYLTAAATAQTVTVLAGGAGGSPDGVGTSAGFSNPGGMCLSADGLSLFVAGGYQHAIRQVVIATGAVSTFSSSGWHYPQDVCCSRDGAYLWVPTNHMVKQIDLSTNAVTVLAGSGTPGQVDGVGTAAQLNQPYSVVASPDGTTLYLSEDYAQRVRQIVLSTGAVTTIAGAGTGYGTGGFADGVGTNALFNRPYGLTVDTAGAYVYVADAENRRIRRIELSSSTVTTFAGSTYGNTDGVGAAAQFYNNWGMTCSHDGDYLFVGGYSSNSIRQVSTADATVTTLVTHNDPTEVVLSADQTVLYFLSRSGGQVLSTSSGLTAATHPASGANGDPHITFAHGGKADFRGSHRASYAFISSPGYLFAPFFQMVDFEYNNAATRRQQLVHGTFMTKALWRVRTSAGRELLIATEAMKVGEASVIELPKGSLALTESELVHAESVTMKAWQRRVYDDVTIETRMLSVSVATAAWTVNVTSKAIYGLVPPLLNQTHVHGIWEEGQRRLDLLIHGAYPQPDAHGIVGQSYQDGTVRHGKLDEYAADDTSTDAPRGSLPPMTTSAQAEGAIEGVYTEYKLSNPFSTAFKYSRYEHTAARPRGGLPQAMRTASATEWDGAAAVAGRKKEL